MTRLLCFDRQIASPYQLRILRIGRALASFEIAFETQQIEAPTRRCTGDIVGTGLEATMRKEQRGNVVFRLQIETDGGAVESATGRGHGVPSDMRWRSQFGDLDLDDHPVTIEAELSGSSDFWIKG